MTRLRFVVTAGPTREHLDPVRFLTNPSTGRMGFAVARAAVRRGHEVTLVAGPVALATPAGVARVDVTSAREMMRAVRASVAGDAATRARTVLVATAAVADWRPARCAVRKLKKSGMSGTLRLVRNPDILRSIRGVTKVGFAAETHRVLAEAERKCREKGLAFIVANDVGRRGSGFGVATDEVTLVYPDGTRRAWPLMTKASVAVRLVRACECAIMSRL